MSLSVLTLNLWHNSGPWKDRSELIRGWIDRLEPDLIGFQEVLRGKDVDLAAELIGDRAYELDFVDAVPFWGDPELRFGNAIASRWPITSREELRLPDRGDWEKRSALTVSIDSPHGPLCFSNTHLHWMFHHGVTREQQVVRLCDQVLRLRDQNGFPPIIVGDFNAEPESDEIRYMTGLHSIDGRSVAFHDAWKVAGQGDGTTWSNRNTYASKELEPDRRIEYIFTGFPLRNGVGHLESCRVVCDEQAGNVWPSDHFGVFARLRTEPF